MSDKELGKETRLSRSIKAKVSDKRAFQTIVQLLGDMESEDGKDVMASGGIPMPGGGAKVSQIMAVVQAQFNKAKDGDTSAATFIRDSGWGKPSANDVTVSTGEKMAISADVMELLQVEAQKRLAVDVQGENSNRTDKYVEIELDEDTGMPIMCKKEEEEDNGVSQ